MVTTRIGGLPELVEDGENGFLAEPGDRIGLAEAMRRVLAMDDEIARRDRRERSPTGDEPLHPRSLLREMTALYAELFPTLAGGRAMIRAGVDGAGSAAHDTIVVGSGPAGLTLAMELARLGRPTLVLESGLDRPSKAQELSLAEIVDPSLHDDMRIAMARRLGGTSNLWGGRCMPLDPIDFVPRCFAGEARWPIGYHEVAHYYEALAATPVAAKRPSRCPRPDLPPPTTISHSTASSGRAIGPRSRRRMQRRSRPRR